MTGLPPLVPCGWSAPLKSPMCETPRVFVCVCLRVCVLAWLQTAMLPLNALYPWPCLEPQLPFTKSPSSRPRGWLAAIFTKGVSKPYFSSLVRGIVMAGFLHWVPPPPPPRSHSIVIQPYQLRDFWVGETTFSHGIASLAPFHSGMYD